MYVIRNSTGEFFNGWKAGEPVFDAAPEKAAHYGIGDATLICQSLAQLCLEPMKVEWR
jgi:hypothetical protein